MAKRAKCPYIHTPTREPCKRDAHTDMISHVTPSGLAFGMSEAGIPVSPGPPMSAPPPPRADPVNHPPHYTAHPSGVECITIVRHMNFNLGSAMKYLWRAGKKGPPIEDLKKAIFYIQDEIKRLETAQG